MKYIFVAGAPGSKWSSVVKNIYYSPDIDHSDYSDERTYYHDASGKMDLMHLGAYYDPGMEFGRNFHNLDRYTKEESEEEFDKPFNGEGIRIVKSHVFSHHIDFIKKTWPDCPIVLVYRGDDSCLGWWVKCGHFNITYPTYDEYYVDLKAMGRIITSQNHDLKIAMRNYDGTIPDNNYELAAALGITLNPLAHKQDYTDNDIQVKVI